MRSRISIAAFTLGLILTSGCTSKKLIPKALKPYWRQFLKAADAVAEECERIRRSPGGCPDHIDDHPAVPLGDLASAPGFQTASASCKSDAPFFYCSFRHVGETAPPPNCWGTYRNADDGPQNTDEPGEGAYISKNPQCERVGASAVRAFPAGGRAGLEINFKGRAEF